MDEDDEKKVLMLFGRNLATIPCFRKSFLYGMGGGVLGGLVTFMFTSRPKFACDLGVATFVGSTLTYWMYCRMNWSKQKRDADKLRALIEQHAAYRGTPLEKEIDEAKKSPPPLIEV